MAHRKAGGRSGGGLHPNVVVAAESGAYAPSEEVEEARNTLAFFHGLDERGETEAELNGKVVDRYEAARAQELIDWAEACAERDALQGSDG